MSGHKWTEAQRSKFITTMRKRRLRKFNRAVRADTKSGKLATIHQERAPATDYVTSRSHFFRIKDGKPYPVRVRRVTLLVLE